MNIMAIIASLFEYAIYGFAIYTRVIGHIGKTEFRWWVPVIILIIVIIISDVKYEEKFYLKRFLLILDGLVLSLPMLFLEGALDKLVLWCVGAFALECGSYNEYTELKNRDGIHETYLMLYWSFVQFAAFIYNFVTKYSESGDYGEINFLLLIIAAVVFLYFLWNAVILLLKDVNQRNEDLKRVAEMGIFRKDYESSAFAKMNNLSYRDLANDKGAVAEYMVFDQLVRENPPYKTLFNVFVPVDSELGSTEVDCIVFTVSSIIVIEVKNRSLKWLIDGNTAYSTDRYGKKHEENCPFVQNQNHINALKNFISSLPDTKFDAETKKALKGAVCGYVVFGPDTIGWEITNQTQGYCSWESIGRFMNNRYNNELKRRGGVNSFLSTSINTEKLYKELRVYQNNKELKNRHNVKLKMKDFWK